ncbi:YihY/virulence factor BrkB family protein [Kytococcus sedentarius]|uniref:YihY/virulence factor BrkB family protein n=1 Tax=Kytococcus sedentarius TaxID=1276 RepID=UPI0035BBFAD9
MTPTEDELWTARHSQEEVEDRVQRDRAARRRSQVAEWSDDSRAHRDVREDRPGQGAERGERGTATRGASQGDADDVKLEGSDWKLVGKRALHEFKDDGCTDLAAGLTYFAVLSIFPAIIGLVSLLGVFGQGESTTQAFLQIAQDLGADPDSTGYTFVEDFISKQQESSGAGIALAIGLLGALWSASNYVNGFSRMMNRIYEVPEGRPVWVLRPVMVLVTAIVLLLVVVLGMSFVLTGPVAESVFGVIGLGDLATTIWAWAKWPAAALIVIFIFRLLYWATPNVKMPRRILTPGAILAFVVWVVASAAFGLYIANFGNYDATYGSMAGVIVFLLWLWLTNTVLLLGAEVDAEAERMRELKRGQRAEEDMTLDLRGESGAEKAAEKEQALVQDAREVRLEAAPARREGVRD